MQLKQKKEGQKVAMVWGASGFIGTNLCMKLKREGYFVIGADWVKNEYVTDGSIKRDDWCDAFFYGDLALQYQASSIAHQLDISYAIKHVDEFYQLAADMGGAGYIFTGEHDLDIMVNSASININAITVATELLSVGKLFYSSSACMYPEYAQTGTDSCSLKESDAYPAQPDSEYGWEKLFSERLYLSAARNKGLKVKIARFHNIYGPYGKYDGGKEKAPAAMIRKAIEASKMEKPTINIWGDGEQTRSFLYIDECLTGIRKLMDSDTFDGPVNIGSDEMVTINKLANISALLAGIYQRCDFVHNLEVKALGVRGRNSNNELIYEKLGWVPSYRLQDGMAKTYEWIKQQMTNNETSAKKDSLD